ncbi:protein max isoform X1 [Rhea pennata]|uniref:protein max isoform X1 n=1 Tax=Rhea pennata TaxID=8795 RepID=UPI002E2690AD
MSDNDDIEVESDEEQPRFQSAVRPRAAPPRPRLTNGLITTHWSASAGTTLKTAFTACGIQFPPSRGRRHPEPKSWTKPQSTSSTCAGKTTHTSRTLTTSNGRTPFWSSKCVHWRKPGRVLSCRPTTRRRTTASTPTPRAAPSLPSMAAPTPAPTPSLMSHKAGRNCAWRPVRPLPDHAGLALATEATHSQVPLAVCPPAL